MSDRITPRVDTLTGVVIVGALPAGATLAWTAVGQSDDHGTVTAPGVADTTQPTALAFQIVDGIQSANYVIRGGKQTAPGNAGNIKLEVVDKNKACKVKVQSAGFSVAAIPVGVQMSKAQAPYGPGVKVKAPPLGRRQQL